MLQSKNLKQAIIIIAKYSFFSEHIKTMKKIKLKMLIYGIMKRKQSHRRMYKY